MEWYWIVLICLIAVIGIVLLTSYICFRITYYVSDKNRRDALAQPLPPGDIYVPHHETMRAWIAQMHAEPRRDVSVTSFDGLTLRGYYYEYEPGAPVELMFHGYRGTSERDLCGGIQRCFALKRNVLIVDQRACGRSEGRVITFGVNESRDLLTWVDFLRREQGEQVPIILTGVSMGAATVMIGTGHALPDNVIGVLADCGYTSARDIIKKVIRDMHLPANLLYPFVRLGGRLYGHFDVEEFSPLEAMSRCQLPIIFFHGETDDFVPCEMSRRNYEACAAPKRLVTVPNAGHGLAFVVDQEGYLQKLDEFAKEYWNDKEQQLLSK